MTDLERDRKELQSIRNTAEDLAMRAARLEKRLFPEPQERKEPAFITEGLRKFKKRMFDAPFEKKTKQ